jgi:hypothetical protein
MAMLDKKRPAPAVAPDDGGEALAQMFPGGQIRM